MILKSIRALALAAVAALSLGVTEASAVTVVQQNQTYSIGFGSEFIGEVDAFGGPGSFEVRFDSVENPLLATASASITNLVAGTFTDLVMSWVAVSDGFVIDSINVTPTLVTLDTIFRNPGVFGGNDINQYLRFTWTNSLKGAGFDFDVVAAVPLPAGGLLLIGAIGGLVALRRRKALAA